MWWYNPLPFGNTHPQCDFTTMTDSVVTTKMTLRAKLEGSPIVVRVTRCYAVFMFFYTELRNCCGVIAQQYIWYFHFSCAFISGSCLDSDSLLLTTLVWNQGTWLWQFSSLLGNPIDQTQLMIAYGKWWPLIMTVTSLDKKEKPTNFENHVLAWLLLRVSDPLSQVRSL